MRKPGRVSAAELAIVPAINGENPRLDPPAYLSKSAQMLFIEIVAGCDRRHFTKSDLPLLASFVEATLMARASAGDLIASANSKGPHASKPRWQRDCD
jgi:hypothetical protein